MASSQETLAEMHTQFVKNSWGSGLHAFNINTDERQELEDSLRQGSVPYRMIDAIIKQWDSLNELHADYYPFWPDQADKVSIGLEMFDNTENIWSATAKYLKEKGRGDVIEKYIYEGVGATEALTSLIEDYATVKYGLARCTSPRVREF